MAHTPKHTPEPWIREGSRIVATGRGVIAQCPRPNDGGVFEFTANIKLLEAAPDMLAALKEARSLLAGELVGVEWKRACYAFIARADATIAKAEGNALARDGGTK